MVVTNDVHAPGPNRGAGWMIRLLESTLLRAATGTRTTGHTLIMYQMQIPKKQDKVDISKIKALSDTLEIACEGTYKLPPKGKMTPIDIIIALTWVINKPRSGAFEQYQQHPHLRITISFDLHDNTTPAPKLMAWHRAGHKLMQCQLMCPVRAEFGMDRNPVPYFADLMPRYEAILDNKNQFGTVPEETRLQLQSCWAKQLLGRRGNAPDQLMGIPITWIRYASPFNHQIHQR